ncbi:BA14K family protein [Brucella melitensis]|uniref:BA14K family protein n=1 Tax=Brucella melitensis TaxID=29459 RepID=UPI000C9F5BE4|nr:BA14K family protein [Brucella melitensis]AUS47694.1 BA14K family protein [Brucella melitensis]
MNRFLNITILAAASLATVAAPLATASADSWSRHSWESKTWKRDSWGPGHWESRSTERGWSRSHSHHSSRSNNDALAAGVIGLAAGALLGSVLSQPRTTYIQPMPVYAAPPPPPPPAYYPAAPTRNVVYRAGYEPWSRGWYQYCSGRYRSFNPKTGTYRGYDGRDHFCTAN